MFKNRNNKLKIALIGGGKNSSIGPAHLTALNSSNNWEVICGIFGKSDNKPPKLLKNSKVKIYKSLADLVKLEKNNLDLFILLTPPTENEKIINLIKKTKLPIISEKPIFNNLNNLEKINNFIKKNKIKFLTSYNYSYYPALRELKYIISKEKKNFSKILIDMPQQGFFLKKNKIKKWRKNDGKIPNLFLDLGSHIFNLAYFLTNSYPSNLICETRSKKNIVVDANIWCRFNKNSFGDFWISKNAGGHENSLKIEIFFENKSYFWAQNEPDKIYYNEDNGRKIIINRSNDKVKFFKDENLNVYKAGHPTGFLETFINFYNFAYKKIIDQNYLIKENDFNFVHSLKIIKILYSMKKSLKIQKWIKTNVK